MPELPEVETVCRGIIPHLTGHTITKIIVRESRLRWPIPAPLLQKQLLSQNIISVARRAKYIFIRAPNGYLIIHLGMSGTLQIATAATPLKKHDHFDCVLSNGKILRFNDPRRFGCILWATNPDDLAIIASLGPEPFSKIFSAKYLLQQAQKRKISIKAFIMNNQVVVGVGNIYASESLFLARINPLMPAQELTLPQASQLCKAIKSTLTQAIKLGGTSLKDFRHSDGKLGYFKNELQVYDRRGEKCYRCNVIIQAKKIGQRMTYFCSYCQD